jgi:hypothetical protein
MGAESVNVENIDYRKLAEQLIGMQQQKAVSGTPTAQWVHGASGLFNNPALDNQLFSALQMPYTGLAAKLPMVPARFDSPLYGIITGVTEVTGDEPDGPCDDPLEAGFTKLCRQTQQFGRYSRQTRVIDIRDAGRLTDRGEHDDFLVIGNQIAGYGDVAGNVIPSLLRGATMQDSTRSMVSNALFTLGVQMNYTHSRKLYTGDPANDTNGGYAEYRGLDLLIATGYQDAITGTACANADSKVLDFGGTNINSGGAAAGTKAVNYITYLYRYLLKKAIGANLAPLDLAIVMPYEAFYELVKVWPVSYETYRVADMLPTNATQFVSGDSVMRARDSMMGNMGSEYNGYSGQYLLIDGKQVPVIIDDAAPVTEVGGGVFECDMYFVPFRVLGRIPVTMLEYRSFDRPNGPMEAARMLAPSDFFMTTDGGRFLVHRKAPNNFCVQMLVTTETRLIMRTPYLAGRINNFRYTPLEPVQSPWPDSSYYKNGGVTTGEVPSYYPPTA